MSLIKSLSFIKNSETFNKYKEIILRKGKSMNKSNNQTEIKVEDFKEMYPRCKDPVSIVKQLNALLHEHGINTDEAIAGFLAQTGHESGGWRTFSENLNYSGSALNAVFGKYFRNVSVSEYARNPEKIANLVYANRMGNGNTASGDGWKYRGRGAIQLTGFNNHKGFSDYLDDIGYDVETLEDPSIIANDAELLVLSAIYFWNREGLTEVCNTGDIKKCTKIINGGYNGLEERTHLFNKWLSILD